MIPILKNKNHKANPMGGEKERKPASHMVPLLSLRSIIAVAIGLILGAGLGLGYWIISPSISSSSQAADDQIGTSSGFLQSLVPESDSDVPWASTVYIQVVNPGSSYMSMRDLQSLGEYYAAKANSLPFLEFLSQELHKQAPQYSHTVDELDSIIQIRYASNALSSSRITITTESENPAIEVEVTDANAQEALFLAKLVPEAFINFLIAEEDNKQELEYKNTLKEIDTVKAALYEAELDLDAFTLQDKVNDPKYIVLSTRVEALQRELDDQAVELTTSIALGDNIPEEYAKTLQQVKKTSASLIAAEEELRVLEKQGFNSNISANATYITLNAKVRALEGELDRLMTGWTETNSTGVEKNTGLAEMIANGDTSSKLYKDRLKTIETVSMALAVAKNELATLESYSGDGLAVNLDYQLAKIKADTLRAELSVLQEKLTILVSESTAGEEQSDAQKAFERTAVALSDAKAELAILESQLGFDRIAMDLDYKVAQEKVNNLNDRMQSLTSKLSSLVGNNAESSEVMTGYLVAGNPSIPTPVPPERVDARNALMIGAIVGIGGALVILNFKWIAKGMSSSGTEKPDEDEEE